MCEPSKEFEFLEQQLLDLIGDFRSVTISDTRLRQAVRTESTRAEAAEAARAAAERSTAEARSGATAANAAASQAAADLAAAYDQLTDIKIQLGESTRLESELRRVERCAAGGSEIRERARLAATAHARERRLAQDELKHTIRELHVANVEISRLTALVTELKAQIAKETSSREKKMFDPDVESLTELRAALQAEREGSEKLEKALAAALSDNATLAAQIHSKDNNLSQVHVSSPPGTTNATNINPIDSFLAE